MTSLHKQYARTLWSTTLRHQQDSITCRANYKGHFTIRMMVEDDKIGGIHYSKKYYEDDVPSFASALPYWMRGFTRIVTGRAWEKRTTSGRRFGIPPVSVDISLGGRLISLYKNDEGKRAGVAAEIRIEYGDRFACSGKTPYDYFTFLMELQAIKTQPLLSRVEITGRLLSKELYDRRNLNLSVGMYQHFDYFDSDTIRAERNTTHLFPCTVPYKLGTPASIGAGSMVRYKPIPSMTIDG